MVNLLDLGDSFSVNCHFVVHYSKYIPYPVNRPPPNEMRVKGIGETSGRMEWRIRFV